MEKNTYDQRKHAHILRWKHLIPPSRMHIVHHACSAAVFTILMRQKNLSQNKSIRTSRFPVRVVTTACSVCFSVKKQQDIDTAIILRTAPSNRLKGQKNSWGRWEPQFLRICGLSIIYKSSAFRPIQYHLCKIDSRIANCGCFQSGFEKENEVLVGGIAPARGVLDMLPQCRAK